MDTKINIDLLPTFLFTFYNFFCFYFAVSTIFFFKNYHLFFEKFINVFFITFINLKIIFFKDKKFILITVPVALFFCEIFFATAPIYFAGSLLFFFIRFIINNDILDYEHSIDIVVKNYGYAIDKIVDYFNIVYYTFCWEFLISFQEFSSKYYFLIFLHRIQ